MIIKYDVDISNENINKNIDRITNQIFKLLPSREEGKDWRSPLHNLILELVGLDRLFIDHVNFLPLISKLETLSTLTEEDDFIDFRKIIFECLGLIKDIRLCLD